MNASVTIPPASLEREIDSALGLLLDAQSYARIMTFWRMGRISDDRAKLLIRDCGLEGFDALAR